MDAVQSPPAHPVRDGLVRQTDRDQLHSGDVAVLADRHAGDFGVVVPGLASFSTHE
jgi:hypothetical protein